MKSFVDMFPPRFGGNGKVKIQQWVYMCHKGNVEDLLEDGWEVKIPVQVSDNFIVMDKDEEDDSLELDDYLESIKCDDF